MLTLRCSSALLSKCLVGFVISMPIVMTVDSWFVLRIAVRVIRRCFGMVIQKLVVVNTGEQWTNIAVHIKTVGVTMRVLLVKVWSVRITQILTEVFTVSSRNAKEKTIDVVVTRHMSMSTKSLLQR